MTVALPSTDAEIREWIVRRLGGGPEACITVELSDGQLNDAILAAQMLWQTWVGWRRTVPVTVPGDGVVPEALIGTDVDTVVDVQWAVDADALAGAGSAPFGMLVPGGMWPVARGGLAAIVQQQGYVDLVARTFSADLTWSWEEGERVLHLFPTPVNGGRVGVTYKSRTFDWAHLTQGERALVLEYAWCKAMQTLSMIRTKFQDKPGAGGNFTLDGDSIWTNADMKLQEIEEKFRQQRRPIGFQVA